VTTPGRRPQPNSAQHRADILLLQGFYGCAYVLLLLNGGLFWDDWTLFHVPIADQMRAFSQSGYPTFSYTLKLLWSLPHSVVLFRLATYACGAAAIHFSYRILRDVPAVGQQTRFWTLLFCAVAPLMTARVALVGLLYVLHYFLFVFGFWLLACYFRRRHWATRLASLFLFTLSFFVPSLLVYYGIVPIFILYKSFESGQPRDVKASMALLIRFADFCAIPVVFWLLRGRLLDPQYPYDTYNLVTVAKLVGSPINTLTGVVVFGKEFVRELVVTAVAAPLACLGTWAIVGFAAARRSTAEDPPGALRVGLVLGIVLLVLGLYPYAVLGNLPSFSDWSSRHQLLLPLGLSLILCCGLQIVFALTRLPRRIGYGVLCGVAALLLLTTIRYQIEFHRDWFKQRAMISQFAQSREMRDHTSFVIVDETPMWNARARRYRFYEYTGMMKLAFGDETRFATSDVNLFDHVQVFNHRNTIADLVPFAEFNIRGYRPQRPQYAIHLRPGTYDLGPTWHVIKLIALDYWAPAETESLLTRALSLKSQKI
jgi:hypothetical protein